MAKKHFTYMNGTSKALSACRRLTWAILLIMAVGTSALAEDEIVMPEYPGGTAALKKYLEENIVYPTAARKMELAGEVVVEFTVERGGAISGVNVIRSLSTELDQEALRVVRGMGRWKPGTKNGVPVRVTMTLPINFKLRKVKGYVDESQETTAKRTRNPFTRNRNKKKASGGIVQPEIVPTERVVKEDTPVQAVTTEKGDSI